MASMTVEEFVESSFQPVILKVCDGFNDLSMLKVSDWCDALVSVEAQVIHLLRYLHDMPVCHQKESAVPSVLLSVNQLKTIYTAVELLWELGIKVFVEAHAKFKIIDTNFPNSILLRSDAVERSNLHFSTDLVDVRRYVQLLWGVSSHRMFSALMLKRNMYRIILTHVTIYHCCDKESMSSISLSKLHELFVHENRMLFVSELRQTSRGPKWMKDIASSLLADLVWTTETGLETLIEGCLSGENSTELQIQVAKLATAIPRNKCKYEYLSKVCKQLVQAMLLSNLSKNTSCLTTLVMIVTRIAHVSPDQCTDLILAPILSPFMSNFELGNGSVFECFLNGIYHQDTAVSLCELQFTAIQLFHAMVSLHPILPPLVKCWLDDRLHLFRRLLDHLLNLDLTCQEPKSVRTRELLLDCCVMFLSSTSLSVGSDKIALLIKTVACYPIGQSVESETFDITNNIRLNKTITTTNVCDIDHIIKSLTLERNIISLQETSSNSCDNDVNHPGVEVDAILSLAAQTLRDSLVVSHADATADSSESQQTQAKCLRVINLARRGKVLCALLIAINKKLPSANSKDNCLASSLFVLCMKSYMTGSVAACATNAAVCDGDCNETEQEAAPHAASPQVLESDDQELSGLLLLVLQAHIPMIELLQQGSSILEVILAVVERHARHIESGHRHDSQNVSTMKKKPIIEVIEQSDSEIDSDDESVEESNSLDHIDSNNEMDEDCAIVQSALTIFGGILGFGNSLRSASEERLIRAMLTPLQMISFSGSPAHVKIADMAHDYAIAILTRTASLSMTKSNPETSPACSTMLHSSCGAADQLTLFLQEIVEICDSHFNTDCAATKALGVRLVLLAEEKHRPRSKSAIGTNVQHVVTNVFLPLLHDGDSFVYLSALKAINKMGNLTHSIVMDLLLAIFSGEESSVQSPVVSCSGKLTARRRAVVSEAIAQLLQGYTAAIAQLYFPRVVKAAIVIIRERPIVADMAVVQQHVQLSALRLCVSESLSAETSASAVIKDDGDPTPSTSARDGQGAEELTRAAELADGVILRQSALSLLADAVAAVGYGCWNCIDDILDVISGVLSMESDFAQVNRASRRSASFLLSHVVQAMADKFIEMESGGSYLSVCYRASRKGALDKDSVVAFHCNNAVAIIDELMIAQLSGSQKKN